MNKKALELTGHMFNNCLVIDRDFEYEGKKVRAWNCLCHCGNKFSTITTKITRGYVTSCGCEPRKINLKNDLTGNRYGIVSVVSFNSVSVSGNYMYDTICGC